MQNFHRTPQPPGHGQQVSAPKFFAVLLAALTLLIVGFLFIKSSFFIIGSVEVRGNKYVATEDICRIAGIPEQTNIFRLNVNEIKSRLEKDLRIAQVDITRKFPDTIVLTITERHPIAYVASNYGFVELDKQGVILAAFKNFKQLNVPVITGVQVDNGYIGDSVSNSDLNTVLEYLSMLDENILNRISEVNIKSNDQIIAYTVGSTQIRIGTSERLAEKARLTNEILRDIDDKKMMIEYIDLHYASPYIKTRQ
jgi:cell division protein FtsQ